MMLTQLLMAVLLTGAPKDGGVKEIPPREFFENAAAAVKSGRLTATTSEQLLAWQKTGSVVLIDLRNEKSFKLRHLKGAVNVPLSELTEEKLKAVIPEKNSQVVVYCDNNFNPTRMIAATTMGAPAIQQLGYSKVSTLEPLWVRPKGHPLEMVEEKSP